MVNGIRFGLSPKGQCMKRAFDFTAALISLSVLFPVLMLVAILVKISSRGPIIFKQKRIGLHNQTFIIYKFRTMRVNAPKNTATHLLSKRENWHTPIGHFLRKTSLDEMPQLFNILKGDMSLVGPRPALWNQFDLIELRTQNGVEKILPGVTGWAQINGRDEISIQEKVKFDVYYLKHQSMALDIKILLKTFWVALTGKNVKLKG